MSFPVARIGGVTAMSKIDYSPILDATCGGRMMWFDHNNPACLYVDNRQLEPQTS